MGYMIDTGYKKRKLVFATLDEAAMMASDIQKNTKIVVSITQTDKKPNMEYKLNTYN